LAASAQLYRAVQLAGACYLVFLGIRGWRATAGHQSFRPQRSPGFRAGLLSNLLNPKVGLFFLAVMPQFIPHHASVTGYALAFAATDAVIAAVWLAAVAWISGKARTLLGRPRVRAALDRAAGTVLVALGLKVAAEQFHLSAPGRQNQASTATASEKGTPSRAGRASSDGAPARAGGLDEGGADPDMRSETRGPVRKLRWRPPTSRTTFDLRASAEAGKEGPLAEWAAACGTDWATYTQEAPGMSAFALADDIVYHTYSAYARGLDALWGMYQWLDRAPRGRNETRTGDAPLNWYRRHDEYDTQ
jgi:uncharacterized protein DUF899/LysE type translocator